MNQAGNRFWLTAKSLIPDTVSGKWVLMIGFVLSLIGDIVVGAPAFVNVFGLYCGMSLGHMACLLKKSERRLMVPGINETCAAVAILIVFGCWIFNSSFALCLGHTIPETYGLMFLLIALGLWIGWGERRLFYAFGFLFLAFLVVQTIPDGSVRVYEWHRDLSIESRYLVGVGLGIASCCILWRFWSLMVSRVDSRTFKQNDYLYLLESTSSKITDEPVVSLPARIPKSFATRATWILYGKPYLTRLHYFWGTIGILSILSILILSRGIEEASSALTSFAAFLFIFVPTMLFMIRVPQSMGRLWLAGVKENRTETAKCLVKIAIRRAMPVYAIGSLLLLIHAPISLAWHASVLSMLMTGICLAGIAFWITSRNYAFWSGNQTLVGLPVAATSIMIFGCLIPVSTTIVPNLSALIEGYEIAVLVVVGLANAIVWTACVFDVSKTLGQSKAIMECQPASEAARSLIAF